MGSHHLTTAFYLCQSALHHAFSMFHVLCPFGKQVSRFMPPQHTHFLQCTYLREVITLYISSSASVSQLCCVFRFLAPEPKSSGCANCRQSPVRQRRICPGKKQSPPCGWQRQKLGPRGTGLQRYNDPRRRLPRSCLSHRTQFRKLSKSQGSSENRWRKCEKSSLQCMPGRTVQRYELASLGLVLCHTLL